MTTSTSAELERRWSRATKPDTVLERRFADGRLVMSVEHDVELGYRVYAPRNGRHLVSPDGSTVTSALPAVPSWRWQRLLFAQVLPLVATLQGLELLHASAAVVGGRAIGFVARAGTGKTSVAAHVVAGGGALMTDDVLALEVSGGAVVAHPGAPWLNIARSELARVPAGSRALLGPQIAESGKVVLAAPVADRVRPLAALYFLDRPAGTALEIAPFEPDPFLLLASSFNTYVRSAARVERQLDVVEALAASVAMFMVTVPPRARAADVARAVEIHAGARR